MDSDEHAGLDSKVVWFAGSLTEAEPVTWFLLGELEGFMISIRVPAAIEEYRGVVSDRWVTFLVIDLKYFSGAAGDTCLRSFRGQRSKHLLSIGDDVRPFFVSEVLGLSCIIGVSRIGILVLKFVFDAIF